MNSSRPQHPEKLWFQDAPPGACEYVTESLSAYSVEGRILYNSSRDSPWVLSVHGARADYTKANAVSFGLQERGISLLGMNLSGHNDASPLPLEKTNLLNNIAEAEAFYKYLDRSQSKVLIGYSLGGTVALELLRRHADEVSHIILFYPGVYSKDAYDKNFGEAFSSVIRKPFSYRDNDILKVLDGYAGKLLVVKGQYDGVESAEPGKSAGEVVVDGKKHYSPIPKEVFDLLMAADMPQKNKRLIEVPGVGHSVILWMRENPRDAATLLDELAAFIRS